MISRLEAAENSAQALLKTNIKIEISKENDLNNIYSEIEKFSKKGRFRHKIFFKNALQFDYVSLLAFDLQKLEYKTEVSVCKESNCVMLYIDWS